MDTSKIILDTDINTDCGDAGAMALLHAFADAGEAEILGIGVCVSNPDVPHAVQAINEYYGRAAIPIAQYQHGPEIEKTGHAFVAPLRAMAKKQAASFASTTKLYRKVLSEAADSSVTFAAIGFMNTLHQLLLSEGDEYSDLSGDKLIQAKVRKLVVMGGQYPTSQSITHYGGAEYNFHRAPASAASVCKNWPTPVVFSGFEVGDTIIAGRSLVSHTPENNPVRKAYELDGFPQGRSAWDETVVFYAVNGPVYQGEKYFEEVNGKNIVSAETGGNFFVAGEGSQSYLKKCLPNERYAELFDTLQTRLPSKV
jgi:inosine-uridine nucleoside N-ribohydrolase